jgi:hypothetical protein
MTKPAKKHGQKPAGTETVGGVAFGQDDPIAMILEQVEDGMVIRVHRLRDDGTRAFAVQLAPQENLEQEIAKCGEGKYLVSLWGRKPGEAKTGHITSKVVHIDKGARADAPTIVAAAAPADRISQALDGAVINLFDTMTKAQEYQGRMLAQAMAPKASSPILEKLLDALIPIAAVKLGDMLTPKPNDTAQLVAALEKVNGGKKPGGFTEIKETLAFLRELRELDPPAGAGAGEPAAVIGETAPWWAQSLERLAIALAPRMMPANRGAEGHTQPALNAGDATDVAEDEVVMPSDLEALQTFIGPLTEWAEQGRTPAWVAETLRFDLKSEYHPLILAELSKPGLVDRLVMFVARLRPHRTWLEEVRVAVVQALGGASGAPGGATSGVEGTGTAGENGGTSVGGRARQARGGQPKQ